MLRIRPSAVLLTVAVAASLPAPVPQPLYAGQWRTVDVETVDILIEQPTRLKQIQPVVTQNLLPSVAGHGQKLTTMVQLFPVDTALFGINRAKGKGRARATCFGDQVQFDLGTRTNKVDRNGNVHFVFDVDPALGCDFFQVEWDFLKRFQLPPGISPIVQTGVELVGIDADPDCFRRSVLCLGSDRFKVEVEWTNFDGQRGNGLAFPRTDQSGTLFFFDPDNTEMLLKVIDGCDFNGHFWVFASATTDVEYNLTVTDTQSGQSRVYDNPLGSPAPAIVDTRAFATCP